MKMVDNLLFLQWRYLPNNLINNGFLNMSGGNLDIDGNYTASYNVAGGQWGNH